MVSGAGEYIARRLAGKGETPFEQGAADLAQTFARGRRASAETAQKFVSSMSPEAQARMAREWTTLDPNKTIWQGDVGEFISSLSLQAAQAIPPSVATLLPAIVAFRAGMAPGALVYLGASEALMSLGSIAANIADEIEKAPEQELMEAPRYRELRTQLGDAAARQQLIREAQGYAPVIGGAVVGLISRTTGKFLEPVFTKGGGIGKRFATGFAAEAPQESSQSGAEQIAQNIAAQIYDNGRVWNEGVLESMVQGGAIGGLIGGGVGAAFGRRGSDPLPMPPPAPSASPEPPADVPEDIRAALKASEEASKAEAELRPTRFDPYTGQGELFPPTGQESVLGEAVRFPEPSPPPPPPPPGMLQRTLDLAPSEVQPTRFNPYTGQGEMFPAPGQESVLGEAVPFPEPTSEQAKANEAEWYPYSAEVPVTTEEAMMLPVPGPRAKNRAERLRYRALQKRQNELLGEQQERAELTKGMVRDEAQLDLFEPEPGVGSSTEMIRTGVRGVGRRELLGFETVAYDENGRPIARVLNPSAEEANAVADKFAERYPEASVRVERRYGQRDVEESFTPITRQTFAGEEPSAEPVADIEAQLEDMQRPDSQRKGVYLSRANIESLRRSGMFERVRGVGVPLPNFDGKGGVVYAKDAETAKELLELRKSLPPEGMEQLLGYITGAGIEKPLGSDIVVQQRDSKDRVVRESLVATPEQAERLRKEFTTGDRTGVVLSLRDAMRRRASLVARDKRAADEAKSRRQTTEAVRTAIEEEELDDGTEADTAERIAGRLTTVTPEGAATKLLSYAEIRRKQSREAQIDGFDLPKNRKFANDTLNERYAYLWDKYVTAQTRAAMAQTAEAKREADDAAEAARQQLVAFMKLNPSTTPEEKIVRVARRVSPETVARVERTQRELSDRVEPFRALPPIPDDLTFDSISKLEGDELDAMFVRAANQLAGMFKARPKKDDNTLGDEAVPFDGDEGTVFRVKGRTADELIEAMGKNDSSKRKLINRLRVLLAARKYGTAKGIGLTRMADALKLRRLRSRSGKGLAQGAVFDTNVLSAVKESQRLSESSVETRAETARQIAEAKQRAATLADELEALYRRMSDRTNPVFESIRTETKDGKLTDTAKDFLYARWYLAAFTQYLRALSKLQGLSIDFRNALKIANKTAENLGKLSPQNLVSELATLGRTEEREATISAARTDPVVLGSLRVPETRAKITKAQIQKVKRAATIDQQLRNNSLYENEIAPFMRALVEYVMSDGTSRVKRGAVYVGGPTKAMAVRASLALEKMKASGDSAAWRSLSQWFSEMGFKRTDEGGFSLSENGALPTEVLLLRRFNRRFGERNTDVDIPDVLRQEREGSKQAIMAQYLKDMKSAIKYRDQFDKFQITDAALERIATMQLRNDAAAKLREQITRHGASVADIVVAEERFFAALEDAGLAMPINDALKRWKVFMPDGTKTIRPIGPRILAKKISRSDGIKAMLEMYRERMLPSEDLAKYKPFKDLVEAKRRQVRENKPNRSAETRRQNKLIAEFERAKNRANDGLFYLEEGGTWEQYAEAGRNFSTLMDEAEGLTDLNSALIALWRGLPSNSGFAQVAQRILDLNMQVDVSWDYGKPLGDPAKLEKVPLGKFLTGQRMRIVLNRAYFDALRTQSGLDAANQRIAHVVLHEAVHAATTGAMLDSREVRFLMRGLLQAARAELRNQGDRKWYGLENEFEFVSEAFTNPEFQQKLAEIKIDATKTMWQRFIDFVRRIIGMPDTPKIENLLDAVLMTTDMLFKGVDVTNRDIPQLPMLDAGTRNKINDVFTRLQQTKEVRDRLRARVSESADSASTGVLAVMTMEQIRDFFGRYFQRDGDTPVIRNPLNEYIRAFSERNAMNSELMEDADRYSRDWTKLSETKPEAAAEMASIMQESTIAQAHPDLPIDHVDNEHLELDEAKAKHAELKRRFEALDPEAQTLYKKVRDFYRTSLKREIALQTLNAIRAIVVNTEGGLSQKEFDAKYNEQSVLELKLNTKKGLRNEFSEEILTDAEISTIVKLAAIPGQYRGPYFPLSRFGDYSVYAEREISRRSFADKKAAREYRNSVLASDPTLEAVIEGDTTVVVTEKEYQLHETRTAAEQAKKELEERYGVPVIVRLRSDFVSREDVISGDASLATLLSKLQGNKAAQAAIKHFYLRSLAEGSFRKHEIKRKKRRGTNPQDQHRAFASYSKASAYYTAQLKHGWRMAEARAQMKRMVREHTDESEISAVRMGQIVREISLRDDATADPTEFTKFVQRGTSLAHFMLLTSPSYWLINASQPYLVTLPWLGARAGYGKAAAALANAQKLIASPLLTEAVNSWGGVKALINKVAAEDAFSVLDQVKKHIKERGGKMAPDYLDMLQQLQRQSIIDLSFVAELRQMAKGTANKRMSRVMDASRIMAHLTEVNNRIVSAIAAYDVARTTNLDHKKSVEFAKQAVSLTQFNYSGANKPRLFQQTGPLGSLGPLVFQFMQYPQHMYALMVSEFLRAVRTGGLSRQMAIETLAGLFITHLAVAGAIGATLQPIKWALGLMFAAFNDDDDRWQDVLSGETYDKTFREMAAELFGTDGGLLLSKGIPAALGADVSDRMSLGTLYFIDLKPETADTFLGSLAISFGGPLVGIGSNAYTAISDFGKGEWWRGVERIMPKMVKDLMQVKRFADEGLVSNYGATLIEESDISPGALFLKSLGFQPTSIDEMYAARSAIETRKMTDEEAVALLRRMFVKAKTPEERQEVREMILEHNQRMRRTGGIPITYADLMRSRANAITRDRNIARYGADLRGSKVRYAKEAEPYVME
jgi:hypothetical protein